MINLCHEASHEGRGKWSTSILSGSGMTFAGWRGNLEILRDWVPHDRWLVTGIYYGTFSASASGYRKTLDSGVMGGNISPPPKKKWIRRKTYLECFRPSISQNSHTIPTGRLFLHDLLRRWSESLSELLRREFFRRRRRLKLKIDSFVSWCVPKTFPTLQESVKGCSSFSSFLKLRSLRLTHVLEESPF